MLLVVEPCSNPVFVKHCSYLPCRALFQEPLSSTPAGTAEVCSSALGCRTLLQLKDSGPLLRSSLSSLASGAVEPCSSRVGTGQALLNLTPVPLVVEPYSNLAIVKNCSDRTCRTLLQGSLNFAPEGTVELCSSALGCRALLQPSDRRALL